MSPPIAPSATAPSVAPSSSSANNPGPTSAAMIAAAHKCFDAWKRFIGGNRFSKRNLRVHYPTLRCGETLFPEWDDFNFAAIEHRGYRRVVRELSALQNQLRDGRKFEKLSRYGCADTCFIWLRLTNSCASRKCLSAGAC